ncbi:hypothetical protein IJH19_00815 [Candidatus Saccharibacteria bacterium]|nr:hypothetical protein [Candidatus Saccharibacteria bacterium]
MKNIKSLLAAGTLVAGLGVSAFSLPTYAATTISNMASYYDTSSGDYILPAGEYTLGANINLDKRITINGAVTLNLNGKNITTDEYVDAFSVQGGGSLTVNGDGQVSGHSSTNGDSTNKATLVVNGGTFIGGEFGGAIDIYPNSAVTINGGSIRAGAQSAIYMYDYAGPSTLTITGGELLSTGDNGIESELEKAESGINVSGGTITGLKNGLGLSSTTGVKLSGGTFAYSNDGGGAIVILGEGAEGADINALLVDGYEYSDSASATGTNEYDTPFVKLTAKSVTVRAKGSGTTPTTPTENNTTTPSSDKQKAMEEMSKEMEKLIAKGTSTGSTKKSTAKTTKVKAPNTGATDGAKAASGLTVLIMATLAGGALLLKKRG